MIGRILGIDMGGTRTRFGVVGPDLSIGWNKIVATSSFRKPSIGEGIVEAVAAYVAEASAEGALDAIVVGVPATVDAEGRRVIQAPNVEGLSGLPIAEMVEEACGIPTVVDKDVNLLLLSDMNDLGISNRLSVAGVYFGTGIGCSLFLNGGIWRGSHGVAGELGHVPQYGYDALCGCGNRGCLEPAGGGYRLAAIHDEKYAGESMDDLFVRHADDPDVQDVLDAMSIAVAGLATLFDPDEVIVGGGLPSMPGFDRGAFEERVRSHVRHPYPAETLHLHYARQGQLSGIVGAALRARSLSALAG